MKLLYKMLSQPLDFQEKQIHTLVIEHPKMYRRAVLSLVDQTANEEADFLLSENGHSLSLERTCAVVSDPFRLDFSNDRKFLSPIYKELAQIAIHELPGETTNIFSSIHDYLYSLLNAFPRELCFDDQTDPAVLLQAFHARPDILEMGFCEKLLEYMELLYEYGQKRLFIFCGLHLCLQADEMKAFLQDATYRKFSVLLLEPHDCQSCDFMKKTILDKDLCEI